MKDWNRLTIEEAYVSYETAKLLKEKGFDEKCNSVYRKTLKDNQIIDEPSFYISSSLFTSNSEFKDKEYKDIIYCSAPTQQMACRWLREKYHIFIRPIQSKIDSCTYEVYYNIVRYYQCPEYFKSYEDATESAIKHCLEHLIEID